MKSPESQYHVLSEAHLKSSRLVLIVCSLLTLSVTACQPRQEKKNARKVRVSTAARAKMSAQAKLAPDTQSETEGEASAPVAALTTTDNVLCNIAVPETCEAISISADGDKLLGINRKSAANSGEAKKLSLSDVDVANKKVTATLEINAKNEGATLMVIALSSDDDIKDAYEEKLKNNGISTMKYKILKTPLVASEVAALKTQIEADKSKVLVIAPTQAEITAARAGLGLAEANRKELVVEVASESRVLLEEALRFYGDVIPLQFVLPHEKSVIELATLRVTLDGRTVSATAYGSTADSADAKELKVWLKDRSTLNAKSKIKIAYTLK